MTTMTTCDLCDAEITEDQYDTAEGFCPSCLALHFQCKDCDERILRADAHPARKTLCQDCGESRAEEERQEALDAAAEELRELVESIIDSEDLAVIRKALAACKRASK